MARRIIAASKKPGHTGWRQRNMKQLKAAFKSYVVTKPARREDTEEGKEKGANQTKSWSQQKINLTMALKSVSFSASIL